MNNEGKGLSLAQELVRSVVRSFYETRHVLIVDALVMHSAIPDNDLCYLMSMNTKDLHKFCGRLREDRLIATHTRAEQREGQLRHNNRLYYYINYQQSVDAIKWRVYQLSKSVQKAPVPMTEKKEYFCPLCKSEWTMLEVLDSCGPMGFMCHKCNSVLTHDTQRNAEGHQQSSRMNDQLKFITDLLPKIDAIKVPDHDFEVAIQRMLPVTREHTHQVAATKVVEPSRPTAVQGLKNTGPNNMKVSISEEDGPSEADKEAERERKERIAKQNALPAWMSQSTVSGESFSGGSSLNPIISRSTPDSSKSGVAAEDQEAARQAEAQKNHEELEDYFARLKAEQAAEREDEDDEDDEEFEEVPPAKKPKLETPAETPVAVDPAEDSEEDLEFEDV
ncbi:putative transcription initiation factor iie subunit alpha protein [Zalerion maritima]|uniref:Transcription initiation factor iie subunit alpha protein n=1 Tax=Zalerion maritima TaxID=339359 RepID=A0AAD5WR45_9PEZI|nr:putative transcription initiation factor iie subunit alpha protein [Zalerion maritima]